MSSFVASIAHEPPSVPVVTSSELSVPAPAPTKNQPEGETAAPEACQMEGAVSSASLTPVAYQPEFSVFPASDIPVVNKPEGSVVASPAAPVANQPEDAVFASSEMAVVNQPKGSIGSGSAAPERKRGRPRRGRLVGSGSKQAPATLPSPVSAVAGQSGVGFMPHIINVGANEDVWAKLISYALINTEAVCVLSATGTISNATLQHGLSSADIVTYVGTFEIFSLSGLFLPSESGGHRSRTGGLSVTLSGPDGRILGGAVAGPLHAHSPVQVIVGTFMVKDQQQVPRKGYNEVYSVTPRLDSSVGGSPATRPTLTESSGGPLSMFNHNAGCCNYTN